MKQPITALSKHLDLMIEAKLSEADQVQLDRYYGLTNSKWLAIITLLIVAIGALIITIASVLMIIVLRLLPIIVAFLAGYWIYWTWLA